MKINVLRTNTFFYTLGLIVCLLALGEPAWAGHDKHYFQGNAFVKKVGTGSGKIYIQHTAITDISTVAEEAWAEDTYLTEVYNCNNSSDEDYLYFLAKENTGSYFWGWYPEASCTEMTDEPEAHRNILKVSGMGSAKEEDPILVTRYAKFSDEPYPYHWYYASLTTTTDPADGSKGRVRPSTTQLNKVKTLASSADVKMDVEAIPMHGYAFTGWTIGANTVVAEGYNASNWQCAFSITSTSEDANAPKEGSATATFAKASPISFTMLKDANRGTVFVSRQYYYIDADTIAQHCDTLTEMGASETKRVYDTNLYPYDRITLKATPSSEYTFYGWYTEKGNRTEFVSGQDSITIIPEESVTYYAYFDKVDADNYFMVGFYQMPTWEDALAAAKANAPCNMVLLKDYTIATPGYYTIPEGVTLLVPYQAAQTPKLIVERTYKTALETPVKYYQLTLASGVHLDVFGDIEAGGRESEQGQSNAANGATTGAYGLISMEAGSEMIIESGASLRAWGYIKGEGMIDVRRGGEVHENFQILDFKGGDITLKMAGGAYAVSGGYAHNKGNVFPINQYFIQNIESRTTYHPGAKLFCSTAWYMSGEYTADDIQLIGARKHKDGSDDDAAMFLMDDEDDSEDTWICKYYDHHTDRQIYEINNSAAIGNFVITMGGNTFPTRNFDLPITNNMTIHLLKGKMDLTQNTVLLPGAEIELDKQSTFIVPAEVALSLYDEAEWDKYVYDGYYAQRVKYSASVGGIPTVRINDVKNKVPCGLISSKPASAAIKVGGTMQVDGAIYTTLGGANISSTNEDAGTILFNTTATSDTAWVCQWASDYYFAQTVSAKLRNTDPLNPISTTAGTPAGQSYCYMNGKWTMMTVDPENECFVKDNFNNYYAKPGAYVQLANGKTENADHTYSDAAGQGRLYILMDECQWWEVELENNLYKGITRDAEDVASPNGKYYAYNTTDNKWEEKRYTITWKDWDGTVITTYQLTYGVTPKFNSTNPTREANLDYTYDFAGWTPAISPVTGDQIYTATYTQTPIRYTITFKNEDGSIIERQFLTRGSVVTPPTIKNGDKILQWNPSISTVTGDQIYTASWLDNTPDTWTITWKNYDGSTLYTANVANGTMPEYKGQTPTKPATAEYTYSFIGWTPEMAAATSNAAYTAQFKETARTYAIRFFREDGTTQIGATQNLAFGASPVLPDPLPTKTEIGYTYTLQWKNMANGEIVGTGIPAVSGNADYQADFSLYTVSLHTVTVKIEDKDGNEHGGCTITGAGTYEYGTEVTVSVVPPYRFIKWKDNNDTNPERTMTLTQDITLTAVCSINKEVDIDQTVEYSSDVSFYNVIINADDTYSGQLIGGENISLLEGGHVYFDLHLNIPSHHWHAFTVPFEVDLNQHPVLADGVESPLGSQCEIVYYDGAVRAAQGDVPECWHYLKNDANRILTPGVAYRIGFEQDVTFVRFTKKDDASINYTGTVTVAENTASNVANSGWNGIGNPATYHAVLDAGVSECQLYNGEQFGSEGYTICDIGTFIVGKAALVQVAATQSVVVDQATAGDPLMALAPRHAEADETGKNRFEIQIAPVAGQMADRMFLLADEDKENKYVILQDLAKAGISTERAQVWVDRYDAQLCKHTAQLVDGNAEFPLGIYAPQAGSYRISIAEYPDGENTLYLTFDGNVIWNLSSAPCTPSLAQGTTKRYGLKWTHRNTPTAITNTQADTQPAAQKILLNNKVFILRGNNLYSVDGQLVK